MTKVIDGRNISQNLKYQIHIEIAYSPPTFILKNGGNQFQKIMQII